MVNIKIGDRVIITSKFLASPEALTISMQNGHMNWKPIGIVNQIDTCNENGSKWEISDNYSVKLYQNPFAEKYVEMSDKHATHVSPHRAVKKLTQKCSIDVIGLNKNDFIIIN